MPDTRVKSLDQIQLGVFVKLVDRDKQGKFSHIGQVTKIQNSDTKNNPYFEMLTFEGIMGFDMTNAEDNELYITTTKPAGWSKFIRNPNLFKSNKISPEIAVKDIKSKKEQVIDLVNANSHKNDNLLLTLAKQQIGGSETQLKNYIKLAKLTKN